MKPGMAHHASRPTVAAAQGKTAADLPPLRLWQAIRANIFTNGYVQDLASRVGCEARELYRVSTDPDNRSEEHRHLLAKWIVPITLGSGRFEILDWLEHQVGRVACVRPAPTVVAGTLVQRIASVVHEAADVQQLGAALLLDGVLPDEAQQIEREISEAQRELEALRLAVRGAVKRAGAKVGAR